MESEKVCLPPCSESEKARVDRDYSGVSSLLNSSKACLESLSTLAFSLSEQGGRQIFRTH